MTKAEYAEYLASRDWAVLREAVRGRSGGRCERCLNGTYDQTHHITYERVGHETLEDLMGLCEACHMFLSAKNEYDPAKATPTVIQCLCGEDMMVPDSVEDLSDRVDLGGAWAMRCMRGHELLVILALHQRQLVFCISRRDYAKLGAKMRP